MRSEVRVSVVVGVPAPQVPEELVEVAKFTQYGPPLNVVGKF